MLSIEKFRHEKEKNYFTVMAIVGTIIWILLAIPLFAAIFVAAPIILIILFSTWLSSLYFKAVIFGNCIHVTPKQFPEIYDIAKRQCEELGLTGMPTIFIQNSDGIINAVAVKTLSKKYIFLNSGLVDLMLKNGKMEELSMVIGHELAHHAAGHTAFFRNLLIFPGRIIPFIGAAYGRACELTADRIGYCLIGDKEAAKTALTAIALGSKALKGEINTQAFIEQEANIPDLMGFIHKIFSSYPRMTRRVIEIENCNL